MAFLFVLLCFLVGFLIYISKSASQTVLSVVISSKQYPKFIYEP